MSLYPIELDKPRNYKYGMRALDLVEKKLKKKMAKIDMDDLTMEETATFMWAGLQHEDKSLTPDKVIDLVDEHSSYTEAVVEMSKALTLAMAGEEALEQMEKEMANAEKGFEPKNV